MGCPLVLVEAWGGADMLSKGVFGSREAWQLSHGGGDPGSGRGQGMAVGFLGQLSPKDVVQRQCPRAPVLAIAPPQMWDVWQVWVGWKKAPEL